jgi:hypothetical protein
MSAEVIWAVVLQRQRRSSIWRSIVKGGPDEPVSKRQRKGVY